jgi:hypothetical protein
MRRIRGAAESRVVTSASRLRESSPPASSDRESEIFAFQLSAPLEAREPVSRSLSSLRFHSVIEFAGEDEDLARRPGMPQRLRRVTDACLAMQSYLRVRSSHRRGVEAKSRC